MISKLIGITLLRNSDWTYQEHAICCVGMMGMWDMYVFLIYVNSSCLTQFFDNPRVPTHPFTKPHRYKTLLVSSCSVWSPEMLMLSSFLDACNMLGRPAIFVTWMTKLTGSLIKYKVTIDKIQTENICGCLIGGFLRIYFLVKSRTRTSKGTNNC